ncbi:MAG: antitoxin Xre/MbcA/ParS toxin-binding domain-containing protein [Mycobacterium sp.]
MLGGPRVLGRPVVSWADLDEVVASGLPRAALDALVTRVAGPRGSARVKYRIVPKATYQRGARLNPAHSQKAERLARVFAMAESIWHDESEARRFMSTPHAELMDRTPLEVAMTEVGARQVEEVIERGRHGLPV